MKYVPLGTGEKHIGDLISNYIETSGTGIVMDFGLETEIDLENKPGPNLAPINTDAVDAVIISHAHADHVGALNSLMRRCNAPIYMTELTRDITRILINNTRKCCRVRNQKLADEWKAEFNEVLDSVHVVPFNTPVQVGSVKFTFFEAGHMPGAAMTLLETHSEGTLLYTGDFCERETQLTDGYRLPEDLHVNRLVMCAPYSRQQRHEYRNNLVDVFEKTVKEAENGKNVQINTRGLTTGLETAACLLKETEERQTFLDASIYVNESTYKLAEAVAYEGISRLQRVSRTDADKQGIYIGCNAPTETDESLDIDLPLHASVNACLNLIRQLDPAQVFLVHAVATTQREKERSMLWPAMAGRSFAESIVVGHEYDI